jgi:hypothetical protein
MARCVDIAAGGAFSVALQADGTVFGWGSTPWGATTGSPMPGQVGRCTALAAGGHLQYAGAFVAALIETPDCNHDGIVDYGQILSGQLADSDANGIPDVCEDPTCASADLTRNGTIDGSDLGAMLGFWGPRNQVFPQADINGDGVVNGADLGLMLSFWGICP